MSVSKNEWENQPVEWSEMGRGYGHTNTWRFVVFFFSVLNSSLPLFSAVPGWRKLLKTFDN